MRNVVYYLRQIRLGQHKIKTDFQILYVEIQNSYITFMAGPSVGLL
jgi:hypothetical protein